MPGSGSGSGFWIWIWFSQNHQTCQRKISSHPSSANTQLLSKQQFWQISRGLDSFLNSNLQAAMSSSPPYFWRLPFPFPAGLVCITTNKWVMKVTTFGYTIHFKSHSTPFLVPHQGPLSQDCAESRSTLPPLFRSNSPIPSQTNRCTSGSAAHSAQEEA